MSNVRESDTNLWLHNKLGNANELWSNGSICSQLNQEVLKNIRECFTDLQPLVKLKLILSFLHIQRRNIEEWRTELDGILKMALSDNDQWVSMVAELLKNFPLTGCINSDINIERNSAIFTSLVHELKRSVRKHGDQSILPIESLYLNKNALNAQIVYLPQPVKHFNLKRKPKSAVLRAELLQKSNDLASSSKKNLNSQNSGVRYRGSSVNDNAPLKGIPSRNSFGSTSSSFRTPNPVNRSSVSVRNPTRPAMPGVRRDGGIKLLDIQEQPIGRDNKRKRKTTDEVESGKLKDNDKSNDQEANATPDYAAGLTSMVPPSPAPSYSMPSTPGPSAPKRDKELTINRKSRNINSNSFESSEGVNELSNKTTVQISPVSVASKNTAITNPTQQYIQISTPQTIQINQQIQQQQGRQTTIISQPIIMTQQNPQQTVQPQVVATQMRTTSITLTDKQIAEARELFRNFSGIGNVEKALILNFMGGSRENPCPNLGDIVTIKLGEKEELTESNGIQTKVIVESHYQMNYSTGEAKTIKKIREA